MKLSRNWLQNYIDLSGQTDEAIEQALTLIGFEVEGVEARGLRLTENIVVGEVETREQHPNADRLSVSMVDVGDGTSRHIVCGAQNYKVGDRVLVALPGARVLGPEGEPFKIKKSKLRGEPSEGMMCSARELGLGEDHSGLLILENRPGIGLPVEQVLTDRDAIFDIEVTPNRPDCLSHIGIARELAAWFDLKLTYPQIEVHPDTGQAREAVVDRIRVDAEEQCPLYFGYSIRGVTITESPDWLKRAIESVGLRPVNNVVDVTNYVLLELGQPLHAFDAAKIRGRELIIRQAQGGEAITTLDERKRELSSSMTVIADADHPLVIAGVMGSLDAEVDASTTDLLLEAAYFRSRFIRQTSRRLGLSTDSSYRFERGIDPENVEYAALRAIDLILEVAGGTRCGPAMQVGNLPPDRREISLNPQDIRDRLGFGPDNREIERVLNRLDLAVRVEVKNPEEERWTVGIPSFRRDLERPIDLAEEFLRIYGCDQIPDDPVVTRSYMHRKDPVAGFLSEAAGILVGRQFQECLHYSLRTEGEVKTWYGQSAAQSLGLSNPLTADQSHLRPSLIPGLLDTLKLNRSRNTGLNRLFERGRVFREMEGNVYELVSVAFLIAEPLAEQRWKQREARDFYSAKAVVEALLDVVGVDRENRVYRIPEVDGVWQAGHTAAIGDVVEDGYHCDLGLLSPRQIKEWDLLEPVLGASLVVVAEHFSEGRRIARYQPVSPFPPVVKDLAIVVDAASPAGTVQQRLLKVAREVVDTAFSVETVTVFDVYEGKGLAEGKKSLAFSLVFRSDERTLNDKEVNQAFETIQKKITENTGYSVRS